MIKYSDTGIRTMIESDLEQVLSWRNHPEVRRYMYSQHEITFDEHATWYARASQDAKRHLLIFEANAKPLGFINIHQIAKGNIADWGFYAAPDAPRGTGFALGHATLQFVFNTAGYHKLCAQVLAFNERSVHFHSKLGFLREGVLRQHHFDGKHYHDVMQFGLLASEWHAII